MTKNEIEEAAKKLFGHGLPLHDKKGTLNFYADCVAEGTREYHRREVQGLNVEPPGRPLAEVLDAAEPKDPEVHVITHRTSAPKDNTYYIQITIRIPNKEGK